MTPTGFVSKSLFAGDPTTVAVSVVTTMYEAQARHYEDIVTERCFVRA
jgi:hypothetical protein